MARRTRYMGLGMLRDDGGHLERKERLEKIKNKKTGNVVRGHCTVCRAHFSRVDRIHVRTRKGPKYTSAVDRSVCYSHAIQRLKERLRIADDL